MTLYMRLLLCLAVIFYFNVATADFAVAASSDSDNQITTHEPKARISDLKDLPKGKGGSWLWAILGAIVVAGGVGAMAGGGDSGGGDDGGGGDTTTGSVGGSW